MCSLWRLKPALPTGFIFLSFFLKLGVLSAEPVALESIQVQRVAVVEERAFDGLVEAVNQATVSAQTSGRVREVNFDVGDYVRKGEVLIRFRDRPQRASYDSAVARYNEANAEFKRISEVYEKKLVARSAFDKAEAALKAARAERDRAQEALENTVVRAPYNGIVVERHIEVGESANVGRKLMTGLSLESLRVITHIPQVLISSIRKNHQARVFFSDGPGVISDSLVINSYADKNTHTFQVRVNLNSGQEGIYPGMFAKVAFRIGEQQKLLVPAKAVAFRSEVTAVYVIQDNKPRLRHVRLGQKTDDGNYVILAGLDEGESIALDPVAAAALIATHRSQKDGE